MSKYILIFSDEFFPQIGGVGNMARTYIDIFNSINFKTQLLTNLSNILDVEHSTTSFKFKILNKLGRLKYPFDVIFLNPEKYHLIILNGIIPTIIFGIFASKRLLNKSIIILHGSEPETIFLNLNFFSKLIGLNLFYKRSLINSRSIVAVSDFMKEKFIKNSSINVGSKIEVVYNSLNPLFFEIVKQKRFSKIKENEINILSVSRITDRKGYLRKINLFEKILKTVSYNINWFVVGEGDYQEEMKIILKEKKLESKVFFLGKKSIDDLIPIYCSSDLFWLLSEQKEAFGLVYAEAQACGCPVIGPNHSGIREAINNEISGYLVDNDIEILKIFEEKKFLSLSEKQIKMNGLKFSSDNFINLIKRNLYQ